MQPQTLPLPSFYSCCSTNTHFDAQATAVSGADEPKLSQSVPLSNYWAFTSRLIIQFLFSLVLSLSLKSLSPFLLSLQFSFRSGYGLNDTCIPPFRYSQKGEVAEEPKTHL